MQLGMSALGQKRTSSNYSMRMEARKILARDYHPTPRAHRMGVINHCIPFVLWYRRKRAKGCSGRRRFFRPADMGPRLECPLVALVGPEISIDDLAAANKSTARETLSHLGRKQLNFHR